MIAHADQTVLERKWLCLMATATSLSDLAIEDQRAACSAWRTRFHVLDGLGALDWK